MNRKEKSLTLALAIAAGLVGGALSNRLFGGEPVFAQQRANAAPATAAKKNHAEKVLRGEELRIIDAEENVLATLGPTGFVLRDRDGDVRVMLSVPLAGEPLMTFHNKRGEIVWRTVPFTAQGERRERRDK